MKAYVCAMHSWCTDLGRLAKKAQRMLKHSQGITPSHHACTHNNEWSYVPPFIKPMVAKANIPQSGVYIYSDVRSLTCAYTHGVILIDSEL